MLTPKKRLKTFAMLPVECYENCEKEFLQRRKLKKLMNEGKGLPDTPANKRTQAA